MQCICHKLRTYSQGALIVGVEYTWQLAFLLDGVSTVVWLWREFWIETVFCFWIICKLEMFGFDATLYLLIYYKTNIGRYIYLSDIW